MEEVRNPKKKREHSNKGIQHIDGMHHSGNLTPLSVLALFLLTQFLQTQTGEEEEAGRAPAQEGRGEGAHGGGLQGQEGEEGFHDT